MPTSTPDDDARADGHAEDADEVDRHDSDRLADSNGARPGAASYSGDPTADDQPAGQRRRLRQCDRRRDWRWLALTDRPII